MVENKTNWNTVLVIVVLGVIGFILLSNTSILSGAFSRDITGYVIGGGGSTNYLAKWTSSSNLGNSIIYDNGLGYVGIGGTFPKYKLDVNGNLRVGDTTINSYTISTATVGTSLYLSSNTKSVVVDSSLYVKGLEGSGSAYACLDFKGKFYRSSVQCL